MVEGFEAAKEKAFVPLVDFLDGVDGGLDERGT